MTDSEGYQSGPLAPRRRPCPVCGTLDGTPLFRQSFEQLSVVTLLPGYDVVVCVRCGFAFADGIPTQETFDSYYRHQSKYEHEYRSGKESDSDEIRFRDIVSTLTRFIPTHLSKILEIGCATGRLLALVREAGFPKIQGLDPSTGCAKAAWDLYEVPVFASSLFNIPSPPDSYDFMILIGVLEHVEDLRTALRHVRAALTSDGRIFAEVPDCSRLAGRPDAPYQEFSIEHINFFSGRSLTNLFTSNGFSRVSAGEAVRQQYENTICPVAFGIYEKSATTSPIERDDITEPGLRRYIEESSAVDARVQRTIADAARGRPLLVWGAGTHTQRLLAAGAFSGIPIVAFVDSNPKYQGQDLQGISIISPVAARGCDQPILISTRGFQREICSQIRNEIGLSNELILLYEDK